MGLGRRELIQYLVVVVKMWTRRERCGKTSKAPVCHQGEIVAQLRLPSMYTGHLPRNQDDRGSAFLSIVLEQSRRKMFRQINVDV